MKQKLLVLLILALLLFFTACGGSEAVSARVPGELVIGESIDLGGYDPNRDMSPFIRFLIFNSLVELGYDYEQIPGLATHWHMSEDGRVWTFYLRDGVQFHDGHPWNAEAARINFQHRIDRGSPGFYRTIETMETPDTYTFIVHLREPMFTFASDISVPTHGMVSPLAYDENHAVTAAVGTGPFSLESWTRDSNFTLAANLDFHRGPPRLERLRFLVIPDSSARAMALQSGDIDMMSGRGALTALEGLRQQEHIQIITALSQTSEFIMINTADPVLGDLSVRRAIAAAVDFQGAVSALLGDLAEPPTHFFAPTFGEFVNPDIQLPRHRPEAVAHYLAAAGYERGADGYFHRDGLRLSFDLLVDAQNGENRALAAVMQQQLRESGIGLTITLLDAAGISERVSAPGQEFQLAMRGQYFIPTDDPSLHYGSYFRSGAILHLYSTPALDEQIDRLVSSLDAAERLALHWELQQEITDAIPVIMMFHRNNVILANENLTDFRLSSGTWQIFKGLETAYVRE